MPHEPTVFLSYRRLPSDDLARFIYDKLKARNVDVFFDREAINGGRFAAIIEREIINRDYFLVILAPDTLESEWVQREIATALRHADKVKIIPVTVGFSLGRVDLPEEIAELAEYDAVLYEREYADASIERIAKAVGLAESLPPPPAPSGGVNIRQNIGTMSGGTVIGSQSNIGAQPPASQRQDKTMQPLPPEPMPKKSSIPQKTILGVLATLVAIILAALALFSEEWRNDAFYKLGLYTATPTLAEVIAPSNTPTDIPAIPTDTDTPPSSTAAPSETPVSTTPVPASDTPLPQTLPMTSPSGEANLRLFMTRESFMLVVDEAVNLNGLQFQVVGRTETLADFFDILRLTSGETQVGDCYVLVKDGAAPPLAGDCAVPARTFKRNVAPADVFWFDTLTGLYKDIAIYQDGQPTGQVCPGGEEGCGIRYGS